MSAADALALAVAEMLAAPRPPDAFRVAVGPEGGFLDHEEAALVEVGFLRAHLGARRLRFETAAVAAVCQIRAVTALHASPVPS